MKKIYFPIKVLYLDNGEEVVVYKPEDICHGRSFTVLQTKVNGA